MCGYLLNISKEILSTNIIYYYNLVDRILKAIEHQQKKNPYLSYSYCIFLIQ